MSIHENAMKECIEQLDSEGCDNCRYKNICELYNHDVEKLRMVLDDSIFPNNSLQITLGAIKVFYDKWSEFI